MHLKLFIISLILISNAYAFKLSPIVETFGFSSKEKTKTFRVVNTGKKKIRLETEVFKRIIDINNKEQRPSSDHFIVYPPQLEVAAGASRAIRVTYIGPETKKEEAYRLIVRQIPDKLEEKKDDKTQISFLFEYVASLYASPKNVKAKLSVVNALKSGSYIDLRFKNIGGKHILLREYKVKLSQGKNEKTIDFGDKKFEKFGSQNILAGIERKILIPDSIFSDGKVKVQFIKD